MKGGLRNSHGTALESYSSKKVLKRKLKVSGDMILVAVPPKYLEWVGGIEMQRKALLP